MRLNEIFRQVVIALIYILIGTCSGWVLWNYTVVPQTGWLNLTFHQLFCIATFMRGMSTVMKDVPE